MSPSTVWETWTRLSPSWAVGIPAHLHRPGDHPAPTVPCVKLCAAPTCSLEPKPEAPRLTLPQDEIISRGRVRREARAIAEHEPRVSSLGRADVGRVEHAVSAHVERQRLGVGRRPTRQT